jgi:hypothetical protein
MTLDSDDIEAIARRVLALMHDELEAAPARLVDAITLARTLGVDRSWVYAHAQALHAIRIGGPRGRLRFDLDEMRRSLNGNGAKANGRRGASRRRGVMDARGELLPIDP